MTILAALAFAAPAHAIETSVTLGTGEHRIEVPAGVTALEFYAYGGRGGGSMPSIGAGMGGTSSGLTPGGIYWAYVGGNGATSLSGAGGGGGATDLRSTRAAGECDGESIADRLWSVGGGGGSGVTGRGGDGGFPYGEGGLEGVGFGGDGGTTEDGSGGGGGATGGFFGCAGRGAPDGAGAPGGYNGGGDGGSGSAAGGGGGAGWYSGGGGGAGAGGGGGSTEAPPDAADLLYTGDPRIEFTWDDTDTPFVAIAEPAEGATLQTTAPVFAGTGGRVLGDGQVQLRFEQGATVVDRSVPVDPETGQWRLENLALARGVWTLTALQADSAGHQGTATRAFTIAADATGPEPSPPEPPPALEATFTPTGGAGGAVILDASATRRAGNPALSFAWDITGDGRADIDCGPATPILDTRLRRSTTVSLAVTDSFGRTSTTSRAVTVTSPTITRPTGSARRTIPGSIFSGSRYESGICKADRSALGIDTTSNGPPPGCNAEVVFGEVKAIGCFERVEAGDLPAAELRLLRPYLDEEIGQLTEAARAGSARAAQVLSERYSFKQARSLALIDSLYMTTQTARVNGVDIVPQKEGAIVILAGGLLNSRKSAVISSDARIQMLNAAGRELRMESGRILQDIVPQAGRALFDGLSIDQEIPLVPALGIRGRVTTRIDRYGLKLDVVAVLPKLLGGITAATKMRAEPGRGLVLDSLDAHADTVPLGPIILRDLALSYRGDTQLLSGGLSVTLPPAGTTVRAEIAFERGAFKKFGIDYSGPPDIILAPAVHITGLGATYFDNPPQFEGRTTLNIGPNPGGGCPKLGVQGTALLDFAGPISLTVEGSSQVLCYKLAQLRAYLDTTGYGSFTGKIEPDLGPLPLRFKVEGTGQMQLPINGKALHLQLNANGEGCLVIEDLIDECIGGEVVVSDEAMGFCGDFGFTHAGAGFRYPPPATYANTALLVAYTLSNLIVMESSCNIDQFRTIRGARAAQASSFTVPASQNVLVLGVVGTDAPPRFVLRGPGGRTIDVPDTGMLRTATEAAFRYASNTTYVLADDPAAGSWTIDLKPGSAAIVDIKLADAQPDPIIKGRVRRAGGRLAFSYDAKLAKGWQVRFFERAGDRGGQLLGNGRDGRGTLRFLPADGGSRNRRIVAEVTRDDLPVDTLTVTRFSSGPPAIGKAKRIGARRKGTRLDISFRRAVNATSHRVTVRLSDGRELLLVTRGRRSRVSVPQVRRGMRAAIAVRGERPGPRLGPAASRRVRVR